MFPFTLQQLFIFQALATEKNFTTAAELVSLSQPSVSKQIKALEKNLNVTLLCRGSHPISFTHHGKLLLEYSERILALSQECYRVLRNLDQGERGTLIIGTTPTLNTYLLPSVIELFAKKYPQISFQILLDSSPIIANFVKNHKVDVGLLSGELSKEWLPTSWVKPFLEDEICFLVPNGYGWLAKVSLIKEDLYKFPLILLSSNSDFPIWMERKVRDNQLDFQKLKISLQLPSLEALEVAVELGLGTALVISSSLDFEKDQTKLRIWKLQNLVGNHSLFLLINSDVSPNPTARLFSDELLSWKTRLENGRT